MAQSGGMSVYVSSQVRLPSFTDQVMPLTQPYDAVVDGSELVLVLAGTRFRQKSGNCPISRSIGGTLLCNVKDQTNIA